MTGDGFGCEIVSSHFTRGLACQEFSQSFKSRGIRCTLSRGLSGTADALSVATTTWSWMKDYLRSQTVRATYFGDCCSFAQHVRDRVPSRPYRKEREVSSDPSTLNV